MVDCRSMNPLDVSGHVLSGYLKQNALLPEELDALKTLIAGRFCQSLVIGAHCHIREPGNDYIINTAERGWQVLTKLWKTPKQELYANWKKIKKGYDV